MGPVPRFPPVPPLPTCRMVPVALTVITPVKSLLPELVTINEPLPRASGWLCRRVYRFAKPVWSQIIIERDRRRVRVPTSETTLVVPRSSKVAKSPELYRSGLPELSNSLLWCPQGRPRLRHRASSFGRNIVDLNADSVGVAVYVCCEAGGNGNSWN